MKLMYFCLDYKMCFFLFFFNIHTIYAIEHRNNYIRLSDINNFAMLLFFFAISLSHSDDSVPLCFGLERMNVITRTDEFGLT